MQKQVQPTKTGTGKPNKKKSPQDYVAQMLERNRREIHVRTPEVHSLINTLTLYDRAINYVRLNMFGKVDGQKAMQAIERANKAKAEFEAATAELAALANIEAKK